MLNALVEGLQILWVHDPDVDMADHVAYFWELIGPPDGPVAADPPVPGHLGQGGR
jgi:hypothetical protein